MDTDSFILYIRIEDSYKYIAKDVQTRLYTSNYELEFNSITHETIIRTGITCKKIRLYKFIVFSCFEVGCDSL